MSEKEQAHAMLDQLGPRQLGQVVRLLRSLTAADTETPTEAERKALAEAEEWLKENAPIPNEDVLAEFGLTQAEWERMAKDPEKQPG